MSWFSYDSSGFYIEENVGFEFIGVYTVLVQITDNNSIGDPNGILSASYSITLTVKDENYEPEWSSTTIPDITVELFATAREDIPNLRDPNEADTHTLACTPSTTGLTIDSVDGIVIDGTQSTTLSQLITCTATDDNAAGSLSDSFTFTLSYIPCTNLAPSWGSALDDVTITDESTLTLVLPSYVEPNFHDSVNWFSTDLDTGLAPGWISISYPDITLSPSPGVELKTFEI